MEHYQTTVEYSLTTFPCSVTALFHHNRIFFTHHYIKTVLHYAILIDRRRRQKREKGYKIYHLCWQTRTIIISYLNYGWQKTIL